MGKSFVAVFLLIFAVGSHTFSVKTYSEDLLEPVDGLSWTFYNESCPNLESIVKATLEPVLNENITQAPGLLRLLFHDCFVQGCDASILLNGTGSGLEDAPNLTIREEALEMIDLIKDAVEAKYPNIVSCADILVLAASFAIKMTGGPELGVPLGRRDSLTFANETVTVNNLPGPASNVSVLIALFSQKGFTDLAELVALSGGHTIGVSHCSSFVDRLYPTLDSTVNESFAEELYLKCPSLSTDNTTDLDIRTPHVFDNKYYVDLQNGEGLFTSDQSLYTDSSTRDSVTSFAVNESFFFERFVLGMLKMVQLDVLTGSEGVIRKVCSASSSSYSIVDAQGQSSSSIRLPYSTISRSFVTSRNRSSFGSAFYYSYW